MRESRRREKEERTKPKTQFVALKFNDLPSKVRTTDDIEAIVPKVFQHLLEMMGELYTIGFDSRT